MAKPYHHGDLRAALLEASTNLLESGGVADLSLRSAAKAAGVSHAAPYRHFKDKRSLLTAVAARGFSAFTEQLQERVTASDPSTQMRQAAVAYVRYALDHPSLFRLMFSGREHTDPEEPELRDASKASLRFLNEIIARGEKAGQFREKSESAPLSAWALVHGLALLQIQGEIDAKDELVEACADHLLQGLRHRGSADDT